MEVEAGLRRSREPLLQKTFSQQCLKLDDGVESKCARTRLAGKISRRTLGRYNSALVFFFFFFLFPQAKPRVQASKLQSTTRCCLILQKSAAVDNLAASVRSINSRSVKNCCFKKLRFKKRKVVRRRRRLAAESKRFWMRRKYRKESVLLDA